MRTSRWLIVLVLVSSAFGASAGEAPKPAGPAANGGQVILNSGSYWRYFYAWASPVGSKGSAPDPKADNVRTPLPPEDWFKPDFDDASWMRLPKAHPFFKGLEMPDFSPNMSVIAVRGRFLVEDPARAGKLRLSVGYRGGVAVYLNGKEIARAGLPASKLAPDALADEYSAGQNRLRKLEGVEVPADCLRKGVNILAIEARRAPLPSKEKGTTVALHEISLTAPAGSSAQPNAGRPKGLQVWTCGITQQVLNTDFGDPGEAAPLRIAGTRNGSFSAKVVVASSQAINGLRVTAGDIEGPGKIPASAVTIRYAIMDRTAGETDPLAYGATYWKICREGALFTEAPATVGVQDFNNPLSGAVQPVWVTVNVPADAAPGDYQSKLTVTAQGSAAVTVPIKLKVCGWKMPDPREFATHMGFVQSPESLALSYNVPLWSDKHYELISKTFDLLAGVGNDVVFIPLIRKTNFGNHESMVRWTRQPDGGLKPDYSVLERYLDLAVKHTGRPKVVVLNVWDYYIGGQLVCYGHIDEKSGGAAKPSITVVDPASGKAEPAEAPAFGTPEGEKFWKEALDGAMALIKKRGLNDGNIVLGMGSDVRPSKACVEFFRKIAPNLGWGMLAHGVPKEIYGSPVNFSTHVHSGPAGNTMVPDPARQRCYGWKQPYLDAAYTRFGCHAGQVNPRSDFTAILTVTETALLCNLRGVGHYGADFFPDAKTKHGIAGRYPESLWRSLTINEDGGSWLSRGPLGALPTAHFEVLREGVQEAEARIFLEKALTDPALTAKLGAELAKRAQAALDERASLACMALRSARGGSCGDWLWYSAGREDRAERLYTLAAEAARALDGK